MKPLLLAAVSALLSTSLWAVDASPANPRATDPSGFQLKDRFNELYAGQVTNVTLPYASTVNIDFNAGGFQTVTLTGNVTFTTTNLVAGRTVVLRVVASGGSRNLTLPSWVTIGAAAPTAVASGKTGLFVLRSFGNTDAAMVYRYEVQP